MPRYREMSEMVMGVLKTFSLLVEPLALDEAFVDLSGTGFGQPDTVGHQMKVAVNKETGLTASVGIGPNKFVAKLATEVKKPDGLTVITPDRAVEFVQAMPVEKLWGVGEKTGQKLRRLGYETALDLARAEPSALKRAFGLLGLRLHELAWARDERPVVPDAEAKSVSRELTFAKNQRNLALLDGILRGLCGEVSEQLKKGHLVGRTVNLKIRYGDFTTVTRQETLGHPSDEPTEIHEVASRLLEMEHAADHRPVRLMGVGITGLLRRTQLNLELFGE